MRSKKHGKKKKRQQQKKRNLNVEKRKPIILVRGPFNKSSGYGFLAKYILELFISEFKDRFKIVLFPTGWARTDDTLDDLIDYEEYILHQKDQQKILQDINQGKINLVKKNTDIFATFNVTIPNEYPLFFIGKKNFGITAGLETDIIPPQWIEIVNKMDGIITTSEHSTGLFRNYEKSEQIKLNTKVETMKWGINTDIFKPISNLKSSKFKFETPFNFLFVGQFLPGSIGQDRKNIKHLLKIFFEKFYDNKDVGLVLKTNISNFSITDLYNVAERVLETLYESDSYELNKRHNILNRIHILHGNLSDKEMAELYNQEQIKALISLTHGEGFGRPLLEAAACGLPIIASSWSGYLDFLKLNSPLLVEGALYDISPELTTRSLQGIPIYMKGMHWFLPQETFVKRILDMFIKFEKRFKNEAIKYAEDMIKPEWNLKKSYEINKDLILKLIYN